MRNEHNFDCRGMSSQHFYPDFRAKYCGFTLLPQIDLPKKPLLIIHNKYAEEWGGAPQNYIDIETLRTLFKSLLDKYAIVYIRHGIAAYNHDYSYDHSSILGFNDMDLLKEFPEVICFDDLYSTYVEKGGLHTLNTFKNILYSRCYHFISSQGGGCHQIALFSGVLLAILHKFGREVEWAYDYGYYNFMTSPSPKMIICKSQLELLGSIPLFTSSSIIDNPLIITNQNISI